MIRQRAGYTIVEVMIFLAVTSGLFVIVFNSFNGQTQRTQFNQSVREMELMVQDWINDVNTGYFPEANIACSQGSGSPPAKPVVSLPTNQTQDTQGQNEGCIFVGKSIYFQNQTSIQTGTIVGNRQYRSTSSSAFREVQSIVESKPTLVPGLVENFNNPYNIPIRRIFLTTTNASLTGFAVVTSFGQTSSGGDLISNGSSSRLLPISGAVGSVDAAAYSALIEGMTDPTGASPITICMQSEYEPQKWGIVLIGNNNSQLSATSFITEAEPEGCA